MRPRRTNMNPKERRFLLEKMILDYGVTLEDCGGGDFCFKIITKRGWFDKDVELIGTFKSLTDKYYMYGHPKTNYLIIELLNDYIKTLPDYGGKEIKVVYQENHSIKGDDDIFIESVRA